MAMKTRSDKAFLAKLGNNIKEARISKFGQRSRTKFAGEVGFSRQYLIDVESGKYAISILVFCAIVKALDVDADTLLT